MGAKLLKPNKEIYVQVVLEATKHLTFAEKRALLMIGWNKRALVGVLQDSSEKELQALAEDKN